MFIKKKRKRLRTIYDQRIQSKENKKNVVIHKTLYGNYEFTSLLNLCQN